MSCIIRTHDTPIRKHTDPYDASSRKSLSAYQPLTTALICGKRLGCIVSTQFHVSSAHTNLHTASAQAHTMPHLASLFPHISHSSKCSFADRF